MKRLYVGNMSFQTTESDLRDLFASAGQVGDIHMVTERETGRSRGFAFVEMPDDEEAVKAIAAMNGKEIGGRALTVNEARPKTQSGFGGGGGGGDRGGRDRGNRGSRW